MIKATFRLIGLLLKKITGDHVDAFSAQAAFFIIISFFPFIMLLLSLVHLFPLEQSNVLRFVTEVFPTTVSAMLFSVITELYGNVASSTLISITAITALWSAAKGFLAIMKGLNAVYEINETRNYFFLRAIAAFYTLIFAIMLLATMVLFVFGNRLYYWIEHKIPFLMDTALVIISLRTILGLIILIAFFLVIYTVIPNRKTKVINELPGAMLCAAGWMGFSYAFSYYIDNFSNYSSMYGSLTAIVLFMLWMYFCMYLLFLGAEFNLLFSNKAFVQKLKRIYITSTREDATHK
ncbi:MAG TPA: YihY/virulence factor BrkB family protein [Clostridiales bacterium]|nr:YihY/virulence factor BrkB family protein [Clostridiales bacterium]